MAQITDEQIESIIELQLVDFNSMESVSVLLRGAIRKALALADAPEPPNRTGQCWQNKKSIHQIWHIVGFHAGQYQIVGKNDAHSNMSEDWLTTYFQRIPPPPADQDVKGWVCREPGNQEPWYETDGCLVGVDGPWYVPLDIAYHGRRRWIPPAKPALPNRKDHWYMYPNSGEVCGPIVSSHNGEHQLQRYLTEGRGYWIYEMDLAEALAVGRIVRIPPKLDGMDADVCRVPGEFDDWYALDGPVFHGIPSDSSASSFGPLKHKDYGLYRWIRNKPALTPWPKLPVTVGEYSDKHAMLLDADGRPIPDHGAVAAALALNMLPKFVAWMRGGDNITTYLKDGAEWWAKRAALLAEIKAAGVKMPGE